MIRKAPLSASTWLRLSEASHHRRLETTMSCTKISTLCFLVEIFFVFSFSVNCHAQETDGGSAIPEEVLLTGASKTDMFVVDVGDLNAMQKFTKVIRLHNSSGGMVQIRNVHRSCNCTDVKILTGEAAAGQMLELSVSVNLEKRHSQLDQALQVTLTTAGTKDLIGLRLTGKLKGFAGFPDSSRELRVPESQFNPEANFRMLISGDVDQGQLSITDSEGKLASSKIVILNGFPVAQCVFKQATLPYSTELIITSKNPAIRLASEASRIRVSLDHIDSVRFLPSVLVFNPTKAVSDAVFEAKAALVLEFSNKDLSHVRNVVAMTFKKKTRLPCDLVKVRDGFYRVSIQAIELEDLADEDKLVMTVVSGNGETVRELKFLVSN